MLVFMHSCDVNGLHRIDNVYLKMEGARFLL